MNKSKKQPVCCIPDLESMKGFTIDKVKEKGQNAVMELVNHHAGAIIKVYVDTVLFGTDLVKYTECGNE